MVIQPLKLFMPVQTLRKQTWGLPLGQARSRGKARIEYSKYQQQVLDTPSLVEQHFLETIKEFEKAALIKSSDH